SGIIGSAKLATQMWEAFTGAKNVSELRSDLLYILDRIGRTEALRQLARQAKPLDDLVGQCLTAFERSRSDPDVRFRARQISAALQEQAGRGIAIKPWLLLFRRLESIIRTETGEASLSCSLENDLLVEQENGASVIEIRLVPSFIDPPMSLSLELGSPDSSVGGEPITINLLEEDPLLKERTVQVQLPIAAAALEKEVRVPYRFSGVTIRKSVIDLRGHWTLYNTGRTFEPIPIDLIRSAWPGASGDPVGTSRGFHGREPEIKKIEASLLSPDRQRSVMIF